MDCVRGTAASDRRRGEALRRAGDRTSALDCRTVAIAIDACGEVGSDPLGSYVYLKRLPGGRDLPCDVDVFPLWVERLLDEWPDAGNGSAGGSPSRKRPWRWRRAVW
jgi:hypothetical protein